MVVAWESSADCGESAQLLNLWHWLAEPSLGKGTLGGWVHGPASYSWPNDRPAALAAAVDVTNTYNRTQLEVSTTPWQTILLAVLR